MTAAPREIPFDRINETALAAYPSLLSEWFSAGRVYGHEFKIGDLQGNAGDSLSINIRSGKWSDFAIGQKGGDPISLYAAAFCAGDRVAAAKSLGHLLNLLSDAPSS